MIFLQNFVWLRIEMRGEGTLKTPAVVCPDAANRNLQLSSCIYHVPLMFCFLLLTLLRYSHGKFSSQT